MQKQMLMDKVERNLQISKRSHQTKHEEAKFKLEDELVMTERIAPLKGLELAKKENMNSGNKKVI